MRRPATVPPRTPRPLAARRAAPGHTLLWVVQGVLAALFLFGGGMKLVLPVEALTAQSPLPAPFLRGVGVLEVLGALGLVLPGLLRLRAELTALAAGGLLLLMCGAVGATLTSPATAGAPVLALVPAAVGALAAVVACGRARPFLRTPAGAAAESIAAESIAAEPTVAERAAAWASAARPLVAPARPAVRRTA
jgi:hypothetical protein